MNEPRRAPNAGAIVTDRRSRDRRARPRERGIDLRGAGRRAELRFLISRPAADTALEVAAHRLELEDWGEPWYTTTYCDTSDHALYRSALSGSGVMFRLREYSAMRPDAIFASPRVWIEWKHETRQQSEKWRFIVPGREVAAALRGEPLPKAAFAFDRYGVASASLRPLVATQCRRVTYTNRHGDLRISLDTDLSYWKIDWPPPNGSRPACPLGRALGHETDVLVEIKWQNEIAEWVRSLRDELRRRSVAEYRTKFEMAMQHLIDA